MLELINVKKIYRTKAGDTAALNDLSLVFPNTGMVFVVGKSGSGKTTLLNVVGGLDGIDGGDIIIDGKKFSEFTATDYSNYRNTFIGFVFQEYNLLPDYSIEKNIKLANELQGKETSKEEIKHLLKLVDLQDYASRKPSQLSGGQKQRVAIARALVKEPKIIMADEPTGALDQATGIQVMETLKKLSKQKLVIVVSHDMELAERYADRIIRLVDGKLAEDVTLAEESISVNLYDTENGLLIKSGADLSESETAVLISAIKNKRKISFADNISHRQKSPTEKIKASHPDKTSDFIKSKMKLKSSIGLGAKSLTTSPLKLIFTIILSVIAFALFGLFDTVGAYDSARIIANTLKTGNSNSVTLSASYLDSDNFSSDIRLNQTAINGINDKTGYNFRGLYEIRNNTSEINDSISVNNPNSERSAIKYNSQAFDKKGAVYYFEQVTDFVEFKKSEIQGNVIDKQGFNLKLLYGRYPELKNQSAEKHSSEDFCEIAVSSYLAESLIYWAKEYKENFIYENDLDELQQLSTPLENLTASVLAEKQVIISLANNSTVLPSSFGSNHTNDARYKIVGIIDCGEIPSEYDDLKNLYKNEEDYTHLTEYYSFLNSGLHLKVFVGEGYVKAWNEFNNRATVYNTSGYLNTGLRFNLVRKSPYSQTIDISGNYRTSFYSSADFNTDNLILIDENADNEMRTNGKLTLNKNQIIISCDNITYIYKGEIAKNPSSKSKINECISTLSSKYSTISSRRNALKTLEELLNSDLKISLTLTKGISNREAMLEQKVEIVGFYFNVNDTIIDKVQSGNGYYPLLLSQNLLQDLDVYTEQGVYARMISPVSGNYSANKALAELIISENGLKTPWYENNVINLVENNKDDLQSFSNLFFYFALALATFSIFMLFNYISTSIVSRHQTIGVLRALGCNSKDVFTIFFTESVIISLINGILACGLAAIGCIFVNLYIKKNIMNLTVAIFGFRQVAVILLLSILTGILSSLIPIIKICKEKPVDLIRRP